MALVRPDKHRFDVGAEPGRDGESTSERHLVAVAASDRHENLANRHGRLPEGAGNLVCPLGFPLIRRSHGSNTHDFTHV